MLVRVSTGLDAGETQVDSYLFSRLLCALDFLIFREEYGPNLLRCQQLHFLIVAVTDAYPRVAYVFVLSAIINHTFKCALYILPQDILMYLRARVFNLILLEKLLLRPFRHDRMDFCLMACCQIIATAMFVELLLKSQLHSFPRCFCLLFRYFTKSDSVDHHVRYAPTPSKNRSTILIDNE